MRVGVVGHRGYVGLPAILGTLLDIAPSLGLTLAFEDDLWDIAEEGDRLGDPSSVDALITPRARSSGESCAMRFRPPRTLNAPVGR